MSKRRKYKTPAGKKTSPIKNKSRDKKASSGRQRLVQIGLILLALAFGAGMLKNYFGPGPRERPAIPANPPPVEAPKPVFVKEGELSFHTDDGEAKKIDIEIADNEWDIEQGLMYRHQMEEDQGMLFVMPEYRIQGFWMKNTLIPLDIIFVDEDKTVVSIQKNAQPLNLTTLYSTGPTRYVIEVNAGFSDNHGIKKGTLVDF